MAVPRKCGIASKSFDSSLKSLITHLMVHHSAYSLLAKSVPLCLDGAPDSWQAAGCFKRQATGIDEGHVDVRIRESSVFGSCGCRMVSQAKMEPPAHDAGTSCATPGPLLRPSYGRSLSAS